MSSRTHVWYVSYGSNMAADDVEHTAPSEAYLAMLETGLRESRGWGDEEVADYFDAIVPG